MKVVEEKKADAIDAQSKLDETSDPEREQADEVLSEAEEQVKTAEQDLKASQDRLKEAKDVRDAVKASRDSALTNTTEAITGTGQFFPVIQRKQLSGRAAEAIANAVERMVQKVTSERYATDICLDRLASLEDTFAKTRKFFSGLKKDSVFNGEVFEKPFENIQTVRDIQTVLNNMKEKATDNQAKQKQAIEKTRQFLNKIKRLEKSEEVCSDIEKASIQRNVTPAAPTKLHTTPGNGEVKLAWTPPHNGGSAITKYQYRQKEKTGGFDAWQDIPSSGVGETNETRYTVPKLTNGTAYIFEVRAKNVAGEGAASTISATPRTTPAAPITLKATSGNEQVTLTWTPPPNDGGAAISRYEYRQSPDGGITWSPDWTSIPGSGAHTTRHPITGLSNGTAYTFEVRAQNAAGAGKASNSVQATPATTPGAPITLKATARNRQVTLAWTTPSDGGAPISRYKYRQSPDKGATWVDWTPIPNSGESTTRYTVPKLTNGTAYIFEVRAKNVAGEGAASTISATPRTTPAAPITLKATSGNEQVTLTWTPPPNDGGAAISRYEYRQSPDGGITWSPDWTSIPGSGAHTTRHPITGLSNGTAYTFEVRAQNAAGAGKVSESANATPKEN